MTDPTADANDAGTIAVPITTIREVRSALLSAQGQAGKSVTDASAEIAALKADRTEAYADRDNGYALLHVAEARLTTASTALEEAETALGPFARFATQAAKYVDKDFRLSNFHEAVTALSAVSSALATIKGLES